LETLIANAASTSAGEKAAKAGWPCSRARMMPLRRGMSVIGLPTLSCRSLPAPAKAGVPGIHPTARAGASGEMDPGDEHRDDSAVAFFARSRSFSLLLQLRLQPAEHALGVALEDAGLVVLADGE